MSQFNVIARERVTLVGEESTFGVTPAGSFPNEMTTLVCLHDDIEVDGLTEEMLDVNDERPRRLDAIHPVHGLQMGSRMSLKTYFKATPASAQLEDGVSAADLAQRILLRHAFGAEFAGQGSTIDSGSSGTSFTVATGEGSRFKKGTWIAVEISGQMEACKVTNISTDTLTVAPALSGTPQNGDIVRNLYNYAPADSHTSSLTVQRAWVGDSSAQYTMNGCHGGVAFAQDIGALCTMAFDLAVTSHVGPSTQSISVPSSVSDDMGAPIVSKPSVYLAASVARGTRFVCEKYNVEYGNTFEMVRDPGATQTVAAVVNTAGRPRAVKATAQIRVDSAQDTAFTADTAYQFIIIHRVGTGTTASFVILEVPAARLTTKPKPTKVGERFYMDLELSGTADTGVTLASETGNDLDRIVAPVRFAFG